MPKRIRAGPLVAVADTSLRPAHTRNSYGPS